MANAARVLGVVLRDLPRHDDASVLAHVDDRGVQRLGADIVEIDVDPLRRCLLECGRQIARSLVVDRDVEPDLLQVGALRIRSCEPDCRATQNLRNLPGRRADCSGRRRHQNDVAFLRLADLEHAEERGQPRNPEHADRRRRLNVAFVNIRIERLNAPPVADEMRLPAEPAPNERALLQLRIARRDHFSHARAFDGRADRQGGGVRIARQPRTHPRIDRDMLDPDQRLPVLQLRQRRLLKLEIVRMRHALRPLCQNPAPVCHVRAPHPRINRASFGDARRIDCKRLARQTALSGPTLTSALPKFSPLKRPKNAFGAFCNPSTTVSFHFIFPSAISLPIS